jgi:hypothetical protein
MSANAAAAVLVVTLVSNVPIASDTQGTQRSGPTPASPYQIAQNIAGPVPTDDEITSAIIAYWGDQNNKRIAQLEADIRSARIEADKGHYEARAKAAPSKCPTDPCVIDKHCTRDSPICAKEKNAKGGLFFGPRIWPGADGLARCAEEIRRECISNETYDWRRTNEKIKVYRDQIQDLTDGPASAKSRADNLVFSVIRKNNYEGNVISYVNVRIKGTDNVVQIKVTIHDGANKWTVIGYEITRKNEPSD